MTVHSDHHHEPNNDPTIPLWVYMTSLGLIILTVAAFGIMLAGML